MAYSGQRIAFEMKDPLILWEEERGGGGGGGGGEGGEKRRWGVKKSERERERELLLQTHSFQLFFINFFNQHFKGYITVTVY